MTDDAGASPAPIPHKWARRIAIAVIGGTLCVIGAAMIVLPGPAMVVIPLGLGILGLEFAWARRWLTRLKQTADGIADGVGLHTPWHQHHDPRTSARVPGDTQDKERR